MQINDRVEDERIPGQVFNNKLFASLIILSTLLFIVLWLAPSKYSHSQFGHFAAWHTLAEAVSIAISVSIFTIMWNANVADKTRFKVNVVSILFLVVAILDAAHLLTFKGMPQWIIPAGHGDAILFWLFARYASAFALILLVSPVKTEAMHSIPVRYIVLLAAVYTSIPFLMFVYYPQVGELFLLPGKGLTGFNIAMEWGVIALLALGLIINNNTRHEAKFYNVNSIILALHMGILSELCFTLYSNAHGAFDVLGHIFKIGSYIFLYKGIAITSLKLPFEKLAENEKILSQIASNIRQIVTLSTVDKGRVFYVNEAFEKITGRSRESLIQDSEIWYQVIHPDDRGKVRDELAVNKGKEFTHEFRMLNENGEIFHVSETLTPVTADNGRPGYITSICEDITNKKKLQLSIAEREQLLNNVLNSIPYMIGYWGRDLRSKFVNKAYSDWFSRTEEELKNIHVKDLLGEELFQQNIPYIKAALDGNVQEFERALHIVNNEVRHTLIHYEPSFVDGEVDGFYVAITDITAVKNAQKRLAISEDRLLRSQTLGHIGSWDIDLRTGAAWWSEENYRVYGILKDTVIDMHTALDMVHPDDRKDLLNVWETSLKSQSTYSHEHRIVTPANEVKYVWEFAEISYDKDNIPRMMAGCTQDITDRKTAELERISLQDQLMQSQKMESIGHLTGGVAHDFNNMLGAILGYTELLKQVMPSTLTEAERINRYITEILTAGNRAKELISQMLTFSRYSPHAHLEAPVVQIQPVVKEVVNLLRSSIPATITINYHIHENTMRAKIHPVQLHQILLNLAINARDSIDDYGRIDISVTQGNKSGTCNSCHQEYSGEYLNITVRDDGVGIDQETMRRVFEPFYTTKEVGKGTGMGLSVVHGIVHSLNGHIEFISEVDKGSTCQIFLPASDSATEPALIDTAARESGDGARLLNGMRIMVVDDELAITSLLTDLLELHGAQVTSFTRSSEALSAFINRPDDFDLVITDETMPELSGTDLSVTMIKKRPRLPVILCTGYSNKVTRDIALKHGISGFMLKPIKAAELINEIITIKSS